LLFAVTESPAIKRGPELVLTETVGARVIRPDPSTWNPDDLNAAVPNEIDEKSIPNDAA
jgi:hypothetical protein